MFFAWVKSFHHMAWNLRPGRNVFTWTEMFLFGRKCFCMAKGFRHMVRTFRPGRNVFAWVKRFHHMAWNLRPSQAEMFFFHLGGNVFAMAKSVKTHMLTLPCHLTSQPSYERVRARGPGAREMLVWLVEWKLQKPGEKCWVIIMN